MHFTRYAARLFLAAMLLAGGLSARAQDLLTGDARTACEAILCLASGQRPDECTPAIKKLMSLKPWKRPGFLSKCPKVDSKHVDNAYEASLWEPEEASVKLGASKIVNLATYIDIQSLSCSAAATKAEFATKFDKPTEAQLAIPDGYTAWDGNLLALKGYSNLRQVRYGHEFHAYAFRERVRKTSLTTGADVEVGPWSIWHVPPSPYDGSAGWDKNACNLNLEMKWSPILTGDSM